MPKQSNILRRSKRVEQEVSDYFWPDQEPDETGSRRDWKELWDVSGIGFDGELIICEVKSLQWPRGTGSLWSILQKAYEQVADVIPGSGSEFGSVTSVAVYKPTNTSIEDAICYLEYRGQMVAMSAKQFKNYFIDGNKMAGNDDLSEK